MYDEIIYNLSLNSDEKDLLVDLLENYDYATNAEKLLISSLIDKLNEE
jgi:hypothetical protein